MHRRVRVVARDSLSRGVRLRVWRLVHDHVSNCGVRRQRRAAYLCDPRARRVLSRVCWAAVQARRRRARPAPCPQRKCSSCVQKIRR